MDNRQDTFYLVNTVFWENWISYTQEWNEGRATRPNSIVNDRLRARHGSDLLQAGIVLDKDYVVVPPRVWRAFVAWYGPSFEVKRFVITYEINLKKMRTSCANPEDFAKNSQQQDLFDKAEEVLVY